MTLHPVHRTSRPKQELPGEKKLRYRGPTRTHRPLLTSPIVDNGNCPVAIQDQRGYGNPDTGLRVVDDPAIPNLADGCDPGAVERGGQPLDGMPFLDGFESGDTAEWSSTVG